ncbi:MAG: hypothetical protein MEQ74_05200 [Paracoccus sp.]|nr:hypothetical protein [Paracoccus sp. (in: a-proteobacteria)]
MMVLKLIPIRAWLSIAGVVVLFAAGWWGVSTYRDGQAAEAQILHLQREVAAAQAALALERARSAADLAAVAAEADAARVRQDDLDALLDAINAADPAGDAPVAPILLDTLRRLK